MFCDQTNVTVSAGKGGNGLVSFRRERCIAKGGPDGGNGGRGADVIVRADENIDTLIDLHTKKKFAAKNGTPGGPKNQNGAAAQDLIIHVPVGTQVYRADTHEILADLQLHNDECIAAVGGRGGFGNAHFTSSIRQTPRFAELGEPGESFHLHLELKLVADVGIIGLPSAGKSTFISSITSARPKVGDFPFTTIVPNLGVAKLTGSRSLIFCDMPGLIEGANKGKGLGHQFLQHVSRNRVLIHLIDITADNPAQNYSIVRNELEKYNRDLLRKPEVIVLSKADVLGGDEELCQIIRKEFAIQVGCDLSHVHVISSVAKRGVDTLLSKVYEMVYADKLNDRKKNPQNIREKIVFQPHFVKNPKAYEIMKDEDEGFRVVGKRIEQIVIQTDFTNHEAVLRVRDVLRKMGIESKLMELGAKKGTLITIGKKVIDLQPDILQKKRK